MTNALDALPRDDRPHLIDERTGEIVLLSDASLEQLAAVRDRIKEDLARQLAVATALIDEQILARLDEAALWTAHVGRLTVSAPSPDAASGVEYDAEPMLRAFEQLAGLSMAAVDRAIVEQPVTYKVSAKGIAALRKLGREDVNAIVDAHSREVEKPRRVTVKAAQA